MVWVYVEYAREVFNCLVSHVQLLESAASNVVGSGVVAVEEHHLVAVLDALFVQIFFQKA